MKWSLTKDAAKTMVHAFVVSRVTLLYITASSIVAVHMPLQNVLNYAAQIILRKRKLDRITADLRDQLHWLPVHQRIEYNVCVLVYKCLHDAAPIYLAECAHQCLHLSIEVISAVQHMAIWQYLAPEQRDIWTTVFLVLLCGTQCGRPCVTHHWQWLSFVHSQRLCYSAKLMKHRHTASVTV